jgi:hypothetical protein
MIADGAVEESWHQHVASDFLRTAQVIGYPSDPPGFALPTRVSSVLEGGSTCQFEPSNVVFALIFLG